MNPKAIFFWSGTAFVAAGAGLPLILPSLPTSVQSDPTLSPIGIFIINQQNWIVLIGLLFILVSLFL